MNNRVRGVLLGLVAGDRIGGPGQLAMNLAESLLENNGFNNKDIEARYLNWWRQDGYDSGPTANHVFELVDSGLSFEEAVLRVHNESGGMTAGCNPAHRNTVLAMSSKICTENLNKYAKQESRMTHYHDIAGEVASTACLLVRMLIEGTSWEKALTIVLAKCSSELLAYLYPTNHSELSDDGYAPHVLNAALYFVGRSGSFDVALKDSIEFAGNCNYCPVLVGSLAGARWGASQISNSWLAGVRNIERIKDVSTSLSLQW